MAERRTRTRPSNRRRPPRGSGDNLRRILGQNTAEDPVARAQGSLDNVFTRLIESPAPDVVKNDARSIAQRVGSSSLGFLGDVIDVIDTPRAAVVSAIKEISDIPSGQASFGDFFQQTVDNIGFGDVVGSTGNIWADRVLGFVGDVALDPLTYATFGASTIAKPGLMATRISANKVAERLLSEGVEKLGKEAAERAAARVTQRGVFAATAEELAAVGVQKGLFFTLPGTGRVGRAAARSLGAKAPREALVGGVGGDALSAFADLGSRYLWQPVRRSKLYESAMKAMSGKTGQFKLELRTADAATEAEKILKAAEGLRQARLASGAEAAFRRDAERELMDFFKKARAVGMTGDQLAKVLREGANETSATFRSLNAPQRALALQAQQWTELLRQRVNAIAGKEVLAKADDYVFRMLTDEGRAVIKKQGKRSRQGSTGFGQASMMNTRLTPGRDGFDTFLGEQLVSPAVAGKSVEEQMMDLARAKFGDAFVQLFEDDWFKIMEGYIRGTSRIAGEYGLERGLINAGVVTPVGAVDVAPFLPNGRINPTHPIQQFMDATYAAIDEAGGTSWLQYLDEGMADMVAMHNADRLEALGLVYGRRFGEDLAELEGLRESVKAWIRAQEFYRAELQSVLAATPDAPTIPQLLRQTEEIDGKVNELLGEIAEIEADMDLVTQQKMAAVLAKRNKAQRLLTDRPSRDAQERAARLIEQADQEEALIFGRRGDGANRPTFEEARAANAEMIGVLDQELLLTNERNVLDSLQRPDPAPTRVTPVDPADMPMSTARRFENMVAFGEGADEINAGLAGVRADNPTVRAVADEALTEVAASIDQVIRDAAAAVRSTGTQQAKDLSATAKRLRAQLKKLKVDGLQPSQMRVASEAMTEASVRLRAELDDVMGRLRAVRDEIKDLEVRKREFIGGRKPPKKLQQRLAAARSTRDALRAQVDELSSLRKELDATSKTLADGAARSSELAAVAGVPDATRAAAADVAAAGRAVRSDAQDARRGILAADTAERRSLGQDTRRVQAQIRGTNRANAAAAGRTDRQLRNTERQLARSQAKVLTPRQQQMVEQQLTYRRQAQQLFDYADTYYGDQPNLRDALRLQAQANVAYADLLERGLNPLRVEDIKKALTGPNGEDIRGQVLWALQEGMKRLGQKSVATGEPWIADAVATLSRVNDPAEIGAFFNIVDKVSTFWKAQAVFSPGFHVRNFMGGMWNNYLAGVELGAYRNWLTADREYQGLLKKFDGDVDLARAAAREKGGAVALVADVEARGIVGGADKTLQDFSGLAGGFSRIGGPFRASQRFGANVVERNLRGALALDVLSKGGTIDDALDAVVKYHFDYTDLSKFEEKVRRVVPFYTWMRNNFPLQVEAIIKQPGKVNRYMAVKRNLERGMEEEGIVPHWFGEQLAIRLPFSMDGSAVYTMPTLPFEDLRLISDIDRLRKGDVSGFAAQVNPFLKAPIEATLGRQFFGKIPFNEGLQEVPRYVTVIPGVPQALDAFGVIERGGDGKFYAEPSTLFMIDQFIPILGQSRRLLPNEPRLQERGLMTAINFAFGAGLRVNSPTEQANELYRRRRALLDMEERLETSGYIMPTYGMEIRVPNPEFEEASPWPSGFPSLSR